MAKIEAGARVKIAAEHLRNTGQYFGPDAPTHVGPWARGEVLRLDDEYLPGKCVAHVKWDNGRERAVLASNLWPCGVPEPA